QKPVDAVPNRAILRWQLVGANAAARGVAEDQLPGVSNYLKGNDPRQWQANVPHFARVRYADVYAGIDLVYYGSQRQVEFDFVVRPGASPATIRLRFTGGVAPQIDPQGNLVLGTPGGAVLQQAPALYQLANGVRQPVTGGFVLRGADEV